MSQNDLRVITAMKDFTKYMVIICSKSPKHFRFTLSNKMLDMTYEVLELIMNANEIQISRNSSKDELELRIQFQREALRKLRVLETFLHFGVEVNCILLKQFEVASRYLVEVIKLLQGWNKNNRERIQKLG